MSEPSTWKIIRADLALGKACEYTCRSTELPFRSESTVFVSISDYCILLGAISAFGLWVKKSSCAIRSCLQLPTSMPLGDWVARTTESTAAFLRTPNGHLVVAASASAIATAAVILGAQNTRRRKNRRHLRDVVEDEIGRLKVQAESDLTGFGTPRGHGPAIAEDGGGVASSEGESETLIGEQLARNIAFLGEEGNQKVRDAFVIVVGMGGVGSAAATMLVRSGVGRIRLIDFDQVTLSSLNVCVFPLVPNPRIDSDIFLRWPTATCDGNPGRCRIAQGRRCKDVLS
jgi:hypothetical protein